jgi:hypothetical protein
VAELRDVIAYVCTRHCDGLSLSISRLTKILYLADWRCCITRGRQVTPIEWKMNDTGPFSQQINFLLRSDKDFEVTTSQSILKGRSERVVLVSDFGWKSISKDDRDVLEFVLKTSREKYLGEFQRLINSTYPVLHVRNESDAMEALDLLGLAAQYANEIPLAPCA